MKEWCYAEGVWWGGQRVVCSGEGLGCNGRAGTRKAQASGTGTSARGTGAVRTRRLHRHGTPSRVACLAALATLCCLLFGAEKSIMSYTILFEPCAALRWLGIATQGMHRGWAMPWDMRWLWAVGLSGHCLRSCILWCWYNCCFGLHRCGYLPPDAPASQAFLVSAFVFLIFGWRHLIQVLCLLRLTCPCPPPESLSCLPPGSHCISGSGHKNYAIP